MKKWTNELNLNSDIWRGEIYDTRDEAIKDGMKEAIEYERKNFKIGIIEDVPNFGIDVDRVIDDIQNTMCDEAGEVAENYLDGTNTEHLLELEEQLNEVFYRWQKRYGYKPTFYRVVSEEIIEVK